MNPVFDAASIVDLQACERRFVLSSHYRPVRWNAKYLFDAILRRAVLHLSNGRNVEEVRTAARSQYLQSAANPGIDDPHPYPVAQEYVTLLNVLITTLSITGAVPQGLREGPTGKLEDFSWRVSSFLDSTGYPHRWITVDRWDAQRTIQEIHSWWVAGDLTILDKPMTVHVLEIGQMRKGQRQSLWVRGWRHPKLANVRRVKFRLSEGKTFHGWDAVRLADISRADVEEWVEWLIADNVPRSLMHTIEVTPGNREKRIQTLADIRREALTAVQLAQADWSRLPMSRGACDFPFACPFQQVCYEGADPEKSGFYTSRSAADSPSEKAPAPAGSPAPESAGVAGTSS